MTNPAELTPLAFVLLGLMASGHCALMCGPLHFFSGAGTWSSLAWMQAGRASSYALMGAVVGALGGWALLEWQIHIPPWIRFLALLALAGLLIRNRRAHGLGCLRQTERHAWHCSFTRGFGLAWLPCPLLFGALGFALLTGSALTGAVLMLGFALGSSLPLMGAARLRQLGRYCASHPRALTGLYLGAVLIGALPLLISQPAAFCGLG